MVPVLQGRVHFLEQLAGLMTTPALIRHRMYVSERAREAQAAVDTEVESDFVDPD